MIFPTKKENLHVKPATIATRPKTIPTDISINPKNIVISNRTDIYRPVSIEFLSMCRSDYTIRWSNTVRETNESMRIKTAPKLNRNCQALSCWVAFWYVSISNVAFILVYPNDQLKFMILPFSYFRDKHLTSIVLSTDVKHDWQQQVLIQPFILNLIISLH